MQIENVARIGLASRRTANQQGQRTVSDGVLGQIVVDNQHVFALLHEIFAHRAACVWRDILHRRKLGRGCADDNGVFHRARARELLDKLRNGRVFLADGNVDADDVLAALVDDGIRRNRGLARLTVADNQFALAAADRDHAVDCLDACLQRDADALALDNARRGAFNRAGMAGFNFALSIDALTQRVDDAADQLLADRNGNDAPRAANDAALVQTDVAAQNNNGNGVLFQVERHAIFAVFKLDQLVGHAAFKAAGARDTVADQNDRTGFVLFELLVVLLDLGLNDF